MFEPTPGEMLTAAGVAELERNAPADVVDELPLPRLIDVDLPPQPGEGAVVLGKTGRAFQRFRSTNYPVEALWYPAVSGATQSYGFTWGDLLTEQRPLLLVQDTRPEAVQS